MRQLTLLLRFRPQATAHQGNSPPGFDIHAETKDITLLAGETLDVPDRAAYRTRVTMTGETTFTEDGVLTLDDANRFDIEVVGEGVFEPSLQAGLLQGAVIWRLKGQGSLSGAGGHLVSTLTSQPDGSDTTEHQVLTLFLP